MIKILLDSGHFSGYNYSPVNSAYNEGDVMFRLTQFLKSELDKYGFATETTRKDNSKDLSLWDRGQMANGFDLMLSLHSNASTQESTDYPVCLCMFDDPRIVIDEASREIGSLIVDTVEKVMDTKQNGRISTYKSTNDRNNNGFLDDEYYGILHSAKQVNVPAVIIEHSFHTNRGMTEWLLDDNNLMELAKAEASTIAQYYEIKKSDISVSQAVQILMSDVGYQLETIQYLTAYRYGESLIVKLAQGFLDSKKLNELGLEADTINFLNYYKYYDAFLAKFNKEV